jgi:hypothetical protein
VNRELNVATDWTEIPITFRAKCYECGKEVLAGPAFWSISKKSAKHLSCAKLKSQIIDKTPLDIKPTIVASNRKVTGNVNKSEFIELKCFVCGKMAGCRECSFSNICNRTVSQLCICERCLNPDDKEEDAFKIYQQVFIRKALG